MNKCKNCKFCNIDELGDMVCTNEDSEYVADYVEENHTCEDWSYGNGKRSKSS